MDTRTIGTLTVSEVGLGCNNFGMLIEQKESDAVVGAALDAGITLFDTADMYGNTKSEEYLGAALGARRDEIVLATKFGGPFEGHSGGATPAYVRTSLEDSLRRLGTDHVDLYQLHRVDPAVPLEETWGAMAETVSAGKARHIGLSEVSVDEIKLAQSVHTVATVQSEMSLWTRDVLPEVLPYCQEQGIGFLPFSPLGRGFLAGRFASFDDLPQDDFRRKLPRFQQDALRANLAIVAGVRHVADRIGVTPAQVALAWVLAHGPQVVPIPGTKTPKYLEENAAAAGVTLSGADLAELDEMPPSEGTRY